MTANPPPVKVLRAEPPKSSKPPPRPEELSELEKVLFPRWLDHASPTGGPDYMGYVMLLITIGLVAVFAVLAIAVVW